MDEQRNCIPKNTPNKFMFFGTVVQKLMECEKGNSAGR
jgi:hypothetical protein